MYTVDPTVTKESKSVALAPELAAYAEPETCFTLLEKLADAADAALTSTLPDWPSSTLVKLKKVVAEEPRVTPNRFPVEQSIDAVFEDTETTEYFVTADPVNSNLWFKGWLINTELDIQLLLNGLTKAAVIALAPFVVYTADDDAANCAAVNIAILFYFLSIL